MQIFLSKFLAFLKNNWKTIVIAAASCIIVWQISKVFTNKETGLMKQMDDLKKIHDEQVTKLEDAYDKELLKKEQNIKQLNKDLQDSKDQYEYLRQGIEDKKKVNIANTTRIYKGDPKGLAQKVNSVLGFEIILPQGSK